jgi:hypothetical protein
MLTVTFNPARPSETLFTVQSVRADTRGRLWLLDTGTLEIGPVLPGAAKLIAVDFTSDEVVQTIVFPPEVALETSYFNDVRFDFSQGQEGGSPTSRTRLSPAFGRTEGYYGCSSQPPLDRTWPS